MVQAEDGHGVAAWFRRKMTRRWARMAGRRSQEASQTRNGQQEELEPDEEDMDEDISPPPSSPELFSEAAPEAASEPAGAIDAVRDVSEAAHQAGSLQTCIVLVAFALMFSFFCHYYSSYTGAPSPWPILAARVERSLLTARLVLGPDLWRVGRSLVALRTGRLLPRAGFLRPQVHLLALLQDGRRYQAREDRLRQRCIQFRLLHPLQMRQHRPVRGERGGLL